MHVRLCLALWQASQGHAQHFLQTLAGSSKLCLHMVTVSIVLDAQAWGVASEGHVTEACAKGSV